jgi:hypothetical protein
VSRKTLSIVVGVAGTICAGLTLLLLLVMGSVFADARSESMAGPGVDVFLRTPFPVEGGKVMLDVEARGGNRAGVEHISIISSNRELASRLGKGVTWGYSISSGHSRGSDTETVEFYVPSDLRAGEKLEMRIEVDYVVAMSHDSSFSNDRKHAAVRLDVKVHDKSGRLVAQLARVALGLGCFAFWFFLVWGIAKLYVKAGDEDVDHKTQELEAIGLLMGMLGGSVLGYWLFAFRIQNALELRPTIYAVMLMIVWIAGPLGWVWKWNKRHKQKRSNLPAARVIAG